ncbi:thioredoxin domain-containing protein [Psychromonas aquimarina]|uniref:thioredoxin domain-containing protein n=1 Tax=Psychromonas aquimarina TaxID=444919 RepID=UPI000422289D|nr:thioredoxin domain-containing protein [Psychromonas aquimarina]
MRKITSQFSTYLILLIAAVIPFLTSACNEQTIDSSKFTTVDSIEMPLPDVVEIFALSCGHCRNIEKMLRELEQKAGISIHKMHAVFNERTANEAYLYYSADIQLPPVQKQRAEFTEHLFDLIQSPASAQFSNGRELYLKELFQLYDITNPEQLTQEQHEKIISLSRQSQDLVNAVRLSAVPTLIIKGKYIINLGAHRSLDDLQKTISYLLNS